MKKILKILSFLLVPSAYLLMPSPVSAHCPLCVGGAVVGLSVARFFGIDDAITGLWLAALIGALSFWTDGYLSKKIKFAYWRPLLYIAFFGIMLWSMYAFNDWVITNLKFYLINKHAGQLLGVDKLTFGLLSGGVVFYIVDAINDYLIKRNGKVYFQFQRVIVPLTSILILSLGFYIWINYVI